MLADEFFTRVTGEALSSSINRRVATVHVVHIECILRVLEKLAVTLFAFAQCLLGLFSFRNISRSAFVVQNLSGFITFGARVYRKPDSRAVFAKRLVLEIANDAMLFQ